MQIPLGVGGKAFRDMRLKRMSGLRSPKLKYSIIVLLFIAFFYELKIYGSPVSIAFAPIVSHFGNPRKLLRIISNFLIMIVFVVVICDQ